MDLEKHDRPIDNIDRIISRNNPIRDRATPSQNLIALDQKSLDNKIQSAWPQTTIPLLKSNRFALQTMLDKGNHTISNPLQAISIL